MSHGPAAMSCGVQLGYSYIPPPGAIPTSQIILSCTGITQPPTSCCENGRPIVTDPCTGQSTCTCQLNPILTAYPKVPSLADQIYNATSLTTQNLLGVEPSAFYSPIKANYDMDRIPEAWKGLPSANPCYPYDPNLAATHPYSGLYSGLDLNSASRRKNATRETTSALKAWLYEHRKNPYPTKGEKIMLAIITKMTLTQVSTWFANARRRLKKENKMTWPSKEKEEVLGGETKDRSSGSQDNDSSDEGKDGLSAIDDDDERLDVSGFDAKDDFLDPVEDEIHPDLSEISDMENEPGLGADKHESSASADSGDDRAGSLSATAPSAGGVRHPPGRGEVGNGRRLDDARPVRKQREEQPPQPAVIPKPKIWSISNIVGTDGSSSSSSSSSSKQASGMHGRGGLGETVPARPSILHYDSAVNRERLRRLQAPSYLSYHELYPGAVLHPPPQHKDALRSICSSGHSLETPPHTPPERLAAAHFDLTQDGTFVQGPLVADHKEMMPLAKGTTTATLLQQ